MEDNQFQELKGTLGLVLKMLAIDKLSGKNLTDQVAILTEFGFRPSEICAVLSRELNEITAIQSRLKKRKSK
jgi:hypothetical protein